MPLPATLAEWEKRQHKFLCTGMNLTAPPDLMPEGKFPYIRNFRIRQAGVLQVRDGWNSLFSSGLSGEVHSLIRFLEEVTNIDKIMIGAGTALYHAPPGGGAPTAAASGFSGFPLTFAAEHPSESALSWLYVADLNKMVKLGVAFGSFLIQPWGTLGPGGLNIPPDPGDPAAVAAQPGVLAVQTGLGRMAAGSRYRYRYLYRTDQGELSGPSLESDEVIVGAEGPPFGPVPITNAVRLTLTPSPESQVFFIDVYRFGGKLNTWRRLPFEPELANPATTVDDEFSDLDIAASDELPEDNFRPFQSIDALGNAVRRDLPFIWGPFNNVIFACGDPARPGDLYWTNPGQPGGHAPQNHLQLCTLTEALVNGFLWDQRNWVFSNENLYTVFANFAQPSFFDGGVTPCGRGLHAPWAFCVGDAIYFLAKDGIYRTNGGLAESITDADLYPLFPHENRDDQQIVNGVQPPRMDAPQHLRLAYHSGMVFFDYVGRYDGQRYTLVFDTKVGGWLLDQYAQDTTPIIMHYSEDGRDQVYIGTPNLARPGTERLLGGTSNSKVFEALGPVDSVGVGINAEVQTPGDDFGDARAQKLYGDGFVEADTGGDTRLVQPLIETETVGSIPATIMTTVGRANKIIELNSGNGQLARYIRYQFTLGRTALTVGVPKLYSYMLTARMKPDQTIKRAIDWHGFLPNEQDAYVRGLKLWVDTDGAAKTVQVWKDGAQVIGINLSVTSVGGENLLVFSWPSFKGRLGRLYPTDDFRWRVTKWEWMATPEPVLEPDWDTNWEKPCGDAPVCYVTGIQVIADTVNLPKTVKLQAEYEGVVTNLVPTGLAGNPVMQHNGRLTINYSFTPFRANQVRLYTTDQVLARLYEARWHAHPEPPTLANWDATFEDFGTPRIIKGVEIYCDTLGGIGKTVRVELDGVLHKLLTVSHDGRQAKTYPMDLVNGEFPTASTVRLLPTDTKKAYLYRVKWWADDEPARLRNWNTSWKDFGKDVLLKGVRIETDTRNTAGVAQAKTVKVQINQADYVTLQVLHNGRGAANYDIPVFGSPPEFPRARTVRLLPTDENPSALYSVEWIADEEPFALANWNAKWEDAGYPGAKFVQGFVVTADTRGQSKVIRVEYEGGSFEVLNVIHTGRRSIAYSFKPPIVAHQLRARPTDLNQSWLYGIEWIYNIHPEAACWWQTQGTTHDLPGFQHLRDAFIALISTDQVQLVVNVDGVDQTPYVIPSTGGLYLKPYVPFRAKKGKLYQYTLKSGIPFRLFVKDCEVRVKEWGQIGPYVSKNPFGDLSRDQGAKI